jgi:hypothetical protein
MTLPSLLRAGRLQRHRTSAQEIADLLRLADRGLADARVEAISTDLRFTAAYNAALALATIPIHCAGYRTRGAGHHVTTFEALPLAMGEGLHDLAAYLDICRQKRSQVEHRRVGQTTTSEVEELIGHVQSLRQKVREWLGTTHPGLLE